MQNAFASSKAQIIETNSNDFNVKVKVEFTSKLPHVINQSKEEGTILQLPISPALINEPLMFNSEKEAFVFPEDDVASIITLNVVAQEEISQVNEPKSLEEFPFTSFVDGSQIFNGDCLEVLKAMPDNSVTSFVTDPPYDLTDNKKSGKSSSKGFMGKEWDGTGIAFNVELWKECLRVLKPGGYILAFGGTRTVHKMASAIEDAGFMIEDQIIWVYGQGMPKSRNIGKDLNQVELEKYGTGLKPAFEPIVVAQKPISEKNIAKNFIKWNAGVLNIDDCRVPYEDTQNPATNPKYRKNNGYKTPPKGQKSNGAVSFSSSKNDLNELGRFPANIIFDEFTGSILDKQNGECGNGWKKKYGIEYSNKEHAYSTQQCVFGGKYDSKNTYSNQSGASRFFYCPKANQKDKNEGLDNFEYKISDVKYGALVTKSSVQKRIVSNNTNAAKHKNNHPTVKPTSLMEYLVKLVTPDVEGAICLDIFGGSGSTAKAVASLSNNIKFILIEKEQEYYDIAVARIQHEFNKQSKKAA